MNSPLSQPPSAPDPRGTGARRADEVAQAQHRQALIEVERRSLLGLFIHLPAWLLVVMSSGLYRRELPLCLLVGALLLANVAARLVLHQRFAALVERRPRLAQQLFLSLLLSSATVWGVLLAVSSFWPPLSSAHLTVMLVALAVCAAGTMNLALLRSVRIGMPLALAGPFVVVLLSNINADDGFLALLIALFLGYVGIVSGSVQRDYWGAVHANALLALRAEELERLSVTDALTQVHNRLYFDRRVAEEWTRAQRGGEPITVLMIDLDHFKRVNDDHGHPFGDLCLKESAAALQRVLYRPGDLLARYGGEEFVVLLPGTDAPAGLTVAERLLAAVGKLVLASCDGPVHISCSIGAATCWPAPHAEWRELLAQADEALYRAKAEGRNRVVANVSGRPGRLSLVTSGTP